MMGNLSGPLGRRGLLLCGLCAVAAVAAGLAVLSFWGG